MMHETQEARRFVERDGTPVEAVQWDGTLTGAAVVEGWMRRVGTGGRIASVAPAPGSRLLMLHVGAGRWDAAMYPSDWLVRWSDGAVDVLEVDDFEHLCRRLTVDELDEEDDLDA